MRIPAARHPGGEASEWKFKGKSGSGARVERELLNASGLADSFMKLRMRPKHPCAPEA